MPKPAKPKKAAPKKPEPVPTFTITKIEPQAKERLVKIYFTDSVTTSGLENSLKIFPPVELEWYNSEISSDNVLTLHGSFRPGQTYKLSLPEDFKSMGGKQYVKSLISFTVPNLTSEISLNEKGTVVERDGRQLLDLSVTNVDEIVFKGLQVPVLLLPEALSQARQTAVNGSQLFPVSQTQGSSTGQATPNPPKPWEKVRSEILSKLEQLKKAAVADPDLAPLLQGLVEDRDAFITKREFNKSFMFSMPLTFRRDKEKGCVELIRLESRKQDQQARSINQVICITDTGISYKISGSSLLIWTTALNTGKVLPGVPVILFTKNNTAFFAGRTGSQGILNIPDDCSLKTIELNNIDRGISDRKLALKDIAFAAAAPPGDAAFIDIKPSGNVKPVGVWQSKETVSEEKLKKGYVFTERGIYRPGETVYFKGAAREYKRSIISPPESLECRFVITDPQGQQVYDKKIRLSEFGTASDSFKAEKYMPLGTYTLTMYYGNEGPKPEHEGDDQGGRRRYRRHHRREGDDGDITHEGSESTTFDVHEFRAPRHFTRISFKRQVKDEPGFVNVERKTEYVICTVEGRYYAGGPVKNGRVRWTARRAATNYERADYPEYSFGYPEEKKEDIIESGEAVLDSSGKVEVPIPVGNDVVSGMQGIELEATVVDFDGRAASGNSVYQTESDMMVGIGEHQDTVMTDYPVSLPVIVIDKAGNRVKSGTVRVKVMERSGMNFPKRNAEGRVYWEYQEMWRDRLSTEIPIKDSQALFDFDFTWGGRFMITFTYQSDSGARFSSGTMFNVGYDSYYYNVDEQENSAPTERLNLVPERESYKPGETARIYFNRRKSFETALVTVERNDINRSEVITLTPGQKYIEVPVTQEYFPNAYVSVLATLPRGEYPMYKEEFDAGSPGFLFGTVNINVKRVTSSINVSINPERKKIQSLPGAEETIDIRCTDSQGNGVVSEMAVCVVDESVLAMTGFKTPRLDSLNIFSGPLAVFTGDIRKELLMQTLYDMLKVEPLTGGDGGEMGRLSKKLRSDFNPVAYFNPAVLTDEDGRASVKFKFPDTMTQYRVYAVACDKGSRFGSGERSAVVVKSFYIEPGLPRFFTKGDAFRFNVAAFNKSDSGGEMAFAADADKGLSITPESQSFKLGPMDSVMAGVTGKAGKPGSVKLNFSGKINGLEDRVQMSLPVNSGYIIQKDSIFGNFKSRASIAYRFPKGTTSIPSDDINPDEASAVLTISGSPFVRLTPALRYLLGYPYGCIEQTSSGVLALSGLRGLIKDGLIPGITIEETDKYLKPGMERLISMQVESGGFSYWPGERTPNPWGSVYASYALTLNMLSGMDVPKDRLKRALDYLLDTANKEGASDTRFKAYVAYILALNGRLDQGLIKNIDGSLSSHPDREAAVVTLLAVKAGGGMKPELQSMARLVLERKKVRESAYHGWYDFYAPYRQDAVELLAASEILPGDKLADDAAKELLAGMQKGIWTSTSDTGWSLIALGRYFKGAKFGGEEVSGKISQGGKTVAEFNVKPAGTFTVPLDFQKLLKEQKVEVSCDSQSRLLYWLSLSYPRMDYAANGYSNGFTVSKEIKNLDGSDAIRVGDVVEVKVRLTTENSDNQFLVIDDPLPAGLVAINSSIKTEEHIAKRPGEADDDEAYWWAYWDNGGFYRLTPNFMEMRDDRVLAFRDHLWRGTYQYSYYARAVCEGDFAMPPTKVQLMYKPDIVGYTPAAKIKIERNR